MCKCVGGGCGENGSSSVQDPHLTLNNLMMSLSYCWANVSTPTGNELLLTESLYKALHSAEAEMEVDYGPMNFCMQT